MEGFFCIAVFPFFDVGEVIYTLSMLWNALKIFLKKK